MTITYELSHYKAFLAENVLSPAKKGTKNSCFLGGGVYLFRRGKFLTLKLRPPQEINPHRNTSFDAKTVAILPKMRSPELRKKSQKKLKKNKKTFEHDISPLCRGAPARPIVLIFCMLGGTHDVIMPTKF